MEIDACLYVSFDDILHHANSPGIGVYLWDKGENHPSQIRGYLPVFPHVLRQFHQIYPPLVILGSGTPLFQVRLPQPRFEVIFSEVCVAARLVQA